MPVCQLDNLTIIYFLMVVKSLKPLLILFFKIVSFSCIRINFLYRYRFSVFVSIFYIGIIFLYLYRSTVSVLFSYILYMIVISIVLITWHAITWHLIPTCYHLTPIWYHLSPATWYITACLVIIIFQKSCLTILYFIYSDLYF